MRHRAQAVQERTGLACGVTLRCVGSRDYCRPWRRLRCRRKKVV